MIKFNVWRNKLGRHPLKTIIKTSKSIIYNPNNRKDYLMTRYHTPVTQEESQRMKAKVFGKVRDIDVLKEFIRREFEGSKSSLAKSSGIEAEAHITSLINNNRVFKNFIGQGFYECYIPPIIKRSIIENPRWYGTSSFSHPELTQGKLEVLYNYQAMIEGITKMDFANASLEDEAAAVAEAMLMAWEITAKSKKTILVSDNIFLTSLNAIKTVAGPLDIQVIVSEITPALIKAHGKDLFGVIIQTPDKYGEINDYTQIIKEIHDAKALSIVGTDLLACTVSEPPGAMNADIVYGNGQRFGNYLGYGGPHAAFFACKETYRKYAPGHYVSTTKDSWGKRAYCLTPCAGSAELAHEHLSRDLSAQIMQAQLNYFYFLFHGEEGIVSIARRVRYYLHTFVAIITRNGYKLYEHYSNNLCLFDTVAFHVHSADEVLKKAKNKGINVWKVADKIISVSFDETTSDKDMTKLLSIFNIKYEVEKNDKHKGNKFKSKLARRSYPMIKNIDKRINGEHELLRYITQLEDKDVSIADTSFTHDGNTNKHSSMLLYKLSSNPKLNLHPFVPIDQARGYYSIFLNLALLIVSLAKMDTISLESKSFLQAEYNALLCIKNYHFSKGERNRNIVLTCNNSINPILRSASKLNLEIVNIQNTTTGHLDFRDFRAKVERYSDNLFGLAIDFSDPTVLTDEQLTSMISLIRDHGGLVYCDLSENPYNQMIAPGNACDICVLNLNKNFGFFNGGNDHNSVLVCAKSNLKAFLPSHPYFIYSAVSNTGFVEPSGNSVNSVVFGHPISLPLFWGYIKTMGKEGIIKSDFQYLMNINYIKLKLADLYKFVTFNSKGFMMNKLIIDVSEINTKTGINGMDISKRLIDYGFSGASIFNRNENLVVVSSSTSESLDEIHRLIEALRCIHAETVKIEKQEFDREDNPLKNAPHTMEEMMSTNWTHKYTREEACYPIEHLKLNKRIWAHTKRLTGVCNLDR